MFNFDTQIKYSFVPKQLDSSINNKSDNNSFENSSIDKPVNTIKIEMPKPPKIKNIVSINFPLIKRLPQQTDISSKVKSLKILNKDLTPIKSKISRKIMIQKILFKNKKFSISKKNNFNFFNESNSISKNYYNISKTLKKERCKSHTEVNIENGKNEIHCVTIGNQCLIKKNELKSNYYNDINYDIHNMSDYSIKPIKISPFKDKQCFSVQRSNKIINNKNFLDSENYLNSDFILQFTKRRKPYCKEVGFNMLKERLFHSNLKKAKDNNNRYSLKITTELPLMKIGSKYNGPGTEIVKNEKQEQFEEKLKQFYENENLKNFNPKRKIVNLSTKSRDEIANIFKEKKLRKCNYLIERNNKNVNKIRDKINKDYNELIRSFNEYDDWDSPENKDNLYDK